MTMNRRELMETAAATAALAAIGKLELPAHAAAPKPPAGSQGADRWVKSVCRYCGTGCGLFVGVKDGKVVAVPGARSLKVTAVGGVRGSIPAQVAFAGSNTTSQLVGAGFTMSVLYMRLLPPQPWGTP